MLDLRHHSQARVLPSHAIKTRRGRSTLGQAHVLPPHAVKTRGAYSTFYHGHVYYSLIGVFFELRYQKCYTEFDMELEDWIKRYLIQTYHRLSQEYFKSYKITFRAALWIVFEQLSSYLFVYWLLFEFTAGKYHLHFDSKLKDWINRYLVETWERLSQEYIKSYRIAFRVALWLVFE